MMDRHFLISFLNQCSHFLLINYTLSQSIIISFFKVNGQFNVIVFDGQLMSSESTEKQEGNKFQVSQGLVDINGAK